MPGHQPQSCVPVSPRLHWRSVQPVHQGGRYSASSTSGSSQPLQPLSLWPVLHLQRKQPSCCLCLSTELHRSATQLQAGVLHQCGVPKQQGLPQRKMYRPVPRLLWTQRGVCCAKPPAHMQMSGRLHWRSLQRLSQDCDHHDHCPHNRSCRPLQPNSLRSQCSM